MNAWPSSRPRPAPSLGIYPDEILQIALGSREGIRPPIAVTEHLRDDITEAHVATLERKQSLIHLGIDPDRTSLACTRHSYHFVVTIYKSILIMGEFVERYQKPSKKLFDRFG